MTTGADIQIENGGFTRIHNAILEALAKADLGKDGLKCVLFLLRMTYGYQRKEAAIGLEEWAKGTNTDRANAARALRNLLKWGVILKTDVGNGRGHKSSYAFNKYSEQWRVKTNSVAGDTVDTVSDDLNSVTGDTDYGDKQCQKGVINSVKNGPSTTSAKERKKEEAAAANDLLAAFVEAYHRIWGLTVASEYVQAEIEEWAAKITLDGWQYALREAADHNKRGNWKYLRGILRRIDQEGYTVVAEPVSSVVDFAVEDIQL